jgi:hypothetical protein
LLHCPITETFNQKFHKSSGINLHFLLTAEFLPADDFSSRVVVIGKSRFSLERGEARKSPMPLQTTVIFSNISGFIFLSEITNFIIAL